VRTSLILFPHLWQRSVLPFSEACIKELYIIFSWTDENSFDLDSVGAVSYLQPTLRCKHISLYNCITFRWSQFVRFTDYHHRHEQLGLLFVFPCLFWSLHITASALMILESPLWEMIFSFLPRIFFNFFWH
jgi:hypothetical protein